MSGLILLWLLLRAGNHEIQKPCPELVSEVVPHWIPAHEYIAKNKTTGFFTATTTLDGNYIQDGTTTDQGAIEHNKRVRECKTMRGEF